MAGLVIVPAVIMSLLLGILEIEFVHNDERSYGFAWFGHALHAIPVMFVLIFVAMNLQWAFALVGFDISKKFWVDLGIRAILGVIAMIKIMAASAILKGSTVGEKFPHALIIGVLVAASPYIWTYAIAPFAKNIPFLGKYLS